VSAPPVSVADVLEGRARWTVLEGDCLAVLPTLADKSVAHVITDPPYSKIVVTSAKSGPGDDRRAAKGLGPKQYGAETRDLGYSGIDDAERAALGGHVARVAQRWMLVFCDAESLTAWRAGLEAGGARHVRMGAWVAPNCTPQFTGDRPGTGWEACEIAHSRKSGRMRWNGGGHPAVWIVPRPANGSHERTELGHPTPKPVDLMLELVELFTDPDEVVLDPFAGSGTTGVACQRLGRRFIGIEKDSAYAAIARERLTAESQGQTLRAYRAGQLPMFGEGAP
jgi:hypothetical protein